jgi:hypothetical protein
MSNKTTTTYMMRVCGDCSSGPPCRCSSDRAITRPVWANGKWVWVAVCTPEVVNEPT